MQLNKSSRQITSVNPTEEVIHTGSEIIKLNKLVSNPLSLFIVFLYAS